MDDDGENSFNMRFNGYCASNRVDFEGTPGSDNNHEENRRLNAKQLLFLLTHSSSYNPEELLDILNDKTVELHILLKHIRYRTHNSVCRDVLNWERLIQILKNGEMNELIHFLLYEPDRLNLRIKESIHPYYVWYSRSEPQSTVSSTSGGQLGSRMVRLTTSSKWAQLSSMYHHLQHPSGLPMYSNLMIFRDGVEPVTTDPANVNGGQWIIRFYNDYVDYAWQVINFEFMGNIMFLSAEVCGFVISLRPELSYASVWTRSTNASTVSYIGKALRRYLNLTPMEDHPFQYKAHRNHPTGYY